MPGRLAYSTFTLNTSQQPIVAVMDCDYVVIANTDNINVVNLNSQAGGGSGTQKTLAPGVQEVLDIPNIFRTTAPDQSLNRPRWKQGDIIVYAAAAAGSPQITVSFVL